MPWHCPRALSCRETGIRDRRGTIYWILSTRCLHTPSHAETCYAATAIGAVEHPRRLGDLTCDVCVIGGGFTGLSTALHLAERDYDVVLLEARRAGWGASGRNGGQLGGGQRRSQGELEHLVGAAQARAL